MKRRVRSRVSRRQRASFLSVLGIVLTFSLLVFFGASGFSGKSVDEQPGNLEVTETIFGECSGQPPEQRLGVPTNLPVSSTPGDLGMDIWNSIEPFANGDCQNACSNAILGNTPVQTSTGEATFVINCDLEEQIPQVLRACADACDSQSSYRGYEQEYQYNNQQSW